MSPRITRRILSTLRYSAAAIAIAGTLASAPIHAMPESEPFGFRAEPTDKVSSLLSEPFNYKGEPVTFNSFRIWPNLTLQQEYDDNILATENNTESDFVTVLAPELEIWKSFGRHDFSLLLNAEARRYWDNQDENVENYNVAFNGNLEARKVLNIPMRVIYRDAHLDRKYQRRSSANQIVVSPLNVKRFEAESGFVYKPNRLSLSLLGGYRQIRLGNEDLIAGGTLIRDNRNVNTTYTTSKLSYDFQNGISPYLQLRYADDDYINENPGATTRNNKSLQTLVGADLNFKDLLTGFIGIGIDSRSYDDDTVGDTDDVSLSAEINWEPTAKTRLSLNALRETTEDNLLIARLTKTAFGIKAQQELHKDLFAKANIYYEEDKFDDVDRRDKTFETGIELLKIINPHLQLGAGYNYITQNSSIQGLDFDNSVVFLKAKVAL